MKKKKNIYQNENNIKIAIILTPEGIETISILSTRPEDRQLSLQFIDEMNESLKNLENYINSNFKDEIYYA